MEKNLKFFRVHKNDSVPINFSLVSKNDCHITQFVNTGHIISIW